MRGVRALPLACAIAMCLLPCIASAQAPSVDPAAAEALARRSNCLKCHSVEREKDGPSFKDVAARYRGKADAEAALVRFLKTGARPGKDSHPQVKSGDDAEIANLVRYVLSR